MTSSIAPTTTDSTEASQWVRRARSHSKSASWIKQPLRIVVAFGCVIVIWLISVSFANEPVTFYPTPASVWSAAVSLWNHGMTPAYVGVSLERWGLGIAIGVGAAIPVALLLSLSRLASAMVKPILNFFYSIVELAWIPLFVLWFGYTSITIELSISYVVFFLVLYNTLVGIEQVSNSTVSALRTLGARRWRLTREALLPGALPNIITGVRLGAGYAWRSLIGAEMIAAHSGLGYLIFQARADQDTSATVVGMIIIGTLWLLIDSLYLRPIEKATVERWGLIGVSQ